jgi:hypothetical protein
MLSAEASTSTFRQVARIEGLHIPKLFIAVLGTCQKLDRTLAVISVSQGNLMHQAHAH